MTFLNTFKSITVMSAGVLLLSACSSVSNQDVGRVGGAVVGGVIGSQFGGGSGRVAATIVGALAGGLIGGNIGQRLDDQSRSLALQAEYDALERGAPGRPVAWQGNNGVRGSVVPQQTYQVGSQNCRRYTHTIFIDGVPQEASGTACRNPDGSWSPLS